MKRLPGLLLAAVFPLLAAPALFAQDEEPVSIWLLPDGGEGFSLSEGQAFSFGGLPFRYYAMDKLVTETTPDGRYRTQLDDVTDTMELFGRGSAAVAGRSDSIYKLVGDAALLRYQDGSLDCLSVPTLSILWSLPLEAKVCWLDCYGKAPKNLFVGTEDGLVLVLGMNGGLRKTIPVFKREGSRMSTIIAVSPHELLAIGAETGEWVIRVVDIDEPTGRSPAPPVDAYYEGDPIEWSRGYNEFVIDNYDYYHSSYSPYLSAMSPGRRYVLFYYQASDCLALFDWSDRSITQSTSVGPDYAAGLFVGDSIVLTNYFMGRLFVLDMDMEIVASAGLEYFGLPESYNVSSLSLQGGEVVVTFSRTFKYWR